MLLKNLTIIDALFIDDIQFMIVKIANYETFMANMSHETKITLILLFSVWLCVISCEVEKLKENIQIQAANTLDFEMVSQ